MDQITIVIETRNAAFNPEDGGQCFEVARILKGLAARIENGDIPEWLRDINGDNVGTVNVEKEE